MKKSNVPFVGLHAHSGMGSPFDGLGYPKEHMEYAFNNGSTALAQTDHGNMNAMAYQVQHAKKMKKDGKDFKPIFGVEAYFLPNINKWKEEYEKAIEAYSSTIKINPKNYHALIQRAICCLETEDYEQVIKDCDNARSIDKESSDPPFFRGLAHQYLGEYKEAIKDFTTAIEIDPEFDVGYYARGRSYQEIGDEEKAQIDFAKEKELAPDDEESE